LACRISRLFLRTIKSSEKTPFLEALHTGVVRYSIYNKEEMLQTYTEPLQGTNLTLFEKGTYHETKKVSRIVNEKPTQSA
jgi:hypothetical protein